MKLKVCYDSTESLNGYYDEIIIAADTIEEIREIAKKEVERRGWDKTENYWSESV